VAATHEENQRRRERAYRLVGQIVDGIVMRGTISRRRRSTSSLVSKIADRIESKLNGLSVFGLSVFVSCQHQGAYRVRSSRLVLDQVDERAQPGRNIAAAWIVETKTRIFRRPVFQNRQQQASLDRRGCSDIREKS